MSGEQRRLRSFDGTELGYRVWGERGPWLVLINGLGSSYDTWEPLVAALADRWRILCWDYRGLYGSDAPRDRRRVTVNDHSRDFEQLLIAEGIERAVVCGWSMGVQLAIEAYRRLPERVSGLLLLGGTYGHFFTACFGWAQLPGVVPAALRLGRLAAPLVGRAVRWQVLDPHVSRRLHRFGITAVDNPAIARAARNFAEVDWDLYLATARSMQDHDATAMLRRIDVPTLVVGGGRDVLAPRAVIWRMAEEIPGAELFYLPQGTHYLVLEFPELVVRRIERFLATHYADSLPASGGTATEAVPLRSVGPMTQLVPGRASLDRNPAAVLEQS